MKKLDEFSNQWTREEILAEHEAQRVEVSLDDYGFLGDQNTIEYTLNGHPINKYNMPTQEELDELPF